MNRVFILFLFLMTISICSYSQSYRKYTVKCEGAYKFIFENDSVICADIIKLKQDTVFVKNKEIGNSFILSKNLKKFIKSNSSEISYQIKYFKFPNFSAISCVASPTAFNLETKSLMLKTHLFYHSLDFSYNKNILLGIGIKNNLEDDLSGHKNSLWFIKTKYSFKISNSYNIGLCYKFVDCSNRNIDREYSYVDKILHKVTEFHITDIKYNLANQFIFINTFGNRDLFFTIGMGFTSYSVKYDLTTDRYIDHTLVEKHETIKKNPVKSFYFLNFSKRLNNYAGWFFEFYDNIKFDENTMSDNYNENRDYYIINNQKYSFIIGFNLFFRNVKIGLGLTGYMVDGEDLGGFNDRIPLIPFGDLSVNLINFKNNKILKKLFYNKID